MIAERINVLPRGTRFCQAAFVVADLDEAIAGWLAMGVGPFFTLYRDYPNAIYRGTPEPLAFRAGLAQAGDIQIELIEQTSTGPSAYRDVVPVGATGMHHMCKMTDDYSGDVARLKAAGFAIASELESDGVPTAYVDTRPAVGHMIELIPPVPLLLSIHARVAQAAVGWAGDDPIRDILSVLEA